MTATPARPVDGGVLLDVRVSPGAGRTAIAGLETDAAGVVRLKLRIAAPPVDGAANAAAAAFLAKALGVPKRDCVLTRGDRSRSKTFRISGDSAALAVRVATLAGGAP